MLNVRLNKELEEKLKNYSQQKSVSKSTIVKEALALYFHKEESVKSAYELGDGLFGREGSGKTDKSVEYKALIKKKLSEKHSR